VAREIARGALVPDVARSLPMTVLRDMPVDHYWGYHLLLAPFGLVPDAELGMKAATVVLFAAVFASFYLLLRAYEVPLAWAWALLPMLFSTQDWRYLQLRGGQLVLPLCFLLVYVAFFERRARVRRWLLLGLGYVAVISYHGGLVLLPLHVGGVLALLLVNRALSAPGQFFEPAITAAGMALGLTLNPYMDARASTWRFAALHVGDMGRDTAHLYDDQEIAEFHGFPARLLARHPEWGLLLVATLAAAAIVAWRGRRGRLVRPEVVALAGVALTGVVLTGQAMRVREYAVPLAFALLATLAPRGRDARAPWTFSLAVACLLAPLALLHGRSTLPLIATHLPTREYRGARAVLEANGDRPILNIAEADYCMLRWEDDRVVCVQALSRYFIYPYPALFHDVWELHDHADTSPETLAILRRFRDRGVRLVAVHKTHKMMRFAERHPELLHPVFSSPVNGATIYELTLPEGG
jgi:hypothetical protein